MNSELRLFKNEERASTIDHDADDWAIESTSAAVSLKAK